MPGKYTVAEVETRSGVPASSLRQWERRYGFPKPQRSSAGYRLYTDGDLRQIEIMRGLIADGLLASRAAAMVLEQSLPVVGPRPLADLANELAEALVGLHEARAGRVLSEAFALHDVEAVLLDIVTPTMVKVGELWHAGKILVSTEHFATSFIQGRLHSLLSLMPGPGRSQLALVTCAPKERHELGALILAVLLNRAGFDTVYLGADTPVHDLVEMTRLLRPEAVFLSALWEDAVAQLLTHRTQLRAMEPLLVVGGQAFEAAPELASDLGGVFLGNDVHAVIPEVVRLLESRIVQST